MEPYHVAPSFLLLRGLEHLPQLSQEQDCSVPSLSLLAIFIGLICAGMDPTRDI